MKSASTRSAKAEEQREAAERELSEKERSKEHMHQRLLSLKASYDALNDQLQVAERQASAATERADALESQLSTHR
jgi:chromosome segregation ATPase